MPNTEDGQPTATPPPGAPDRSPAGQAFHDLLEQIMYLNRALTGAAEAVTRPTGQSLARWVVLDECRERPRPVSDIARRLHLARQSVQRIADALDREGLCLYVENPRHRRAKLLLLTPAGLAALAAVDAAQRTWADGVGARIGEPALRAAEQALAPVVEAVRRGGAG